MSDDIYTQQLRMKATITGCDIKPCINFQDKQASSIALDVSKQ